ncbi:hypothetical protein pipiens_000482, partial [Culex pipiens pipiens]
MRLVDTRTAQDEAIWSDPYDASVYCLDYDGAYGVLCGMKQHFRVNLYDLRAPRRCPGRGFEPTVHRDRSRPASA